MSECDMCECMCERKERERETESDRRGDVERDWSFSCEKNIWLKRHEQS